MIWTRMPPKIPRFVYVFRFAMLSVFEKIKAGGRVVLIGQYDILMNSVADYTVLMPSGGR